MSQIPLFSCSHGIFTSVKHKILEAFQDRKYLKIIYVLDKHQTCSLGDLLTTWLGEMSTFRSDRYILYGRTDLWVYLQGKHTDCESRDEKAHRRDCHLGILSQFILAQLASEFHNTEDTNCWRFWHCFSFPVSLDFITSSELKRLLLSALEILVQFWFCHGKGALCTYMSKTLQDQS